MSGKQWLGLVLALIALIALVNWGRNPLRTALPFGTTDLSSVQSQLERLSAEDRKLVEDYVKRSNGDVLPAQFADPDDPLTARNFAQAVALQKRWQEKMKVQEGEAAKRAAQRDLAMSPLREAVTAKIVRREILASSAVHAPPTTEPGAPKRAISGNDHPVFVITVGIYNHTNNDIVDLKGSLQAKDRDNYLPLNLCWIDLGAQQPVAAYGHIEIRCANVARHADENEHAFVEDPPGRFEVVWEPKTVRFADGKTLDSKL